MGTIERKRVSDRPLKVTQSLACSLGQHIHNAALTTHHLALLAKKEHYISILHASIWSI